MIRTAALKDSISKYIDVRFFSKFLAMFLFLYYFNLSYEAITNEPGLVYSPVIDRYLNYVHLVKMWILTAANGLANMLGYSSNLIGDYTIALPNGAAVKMFYECAGFGMSSFWVAFITAHQIKASKRLLWALAGVLFIWIINCLRFVFIIAVLSRDGSLNKSVDHHAVFNYGCYAAILFLGWAFYRSAKQQEIV